MPEGTRFGRLDIHPSERAVTLDGQPVALGARAFDLLMALVSRRDRTVGKNELLDAVWPGLVVEENNLQVQISSLRKLLGAAAITTVPGRGYRFTMAASGPATTADAPADAGTAAPLLLPGSPPAGTAQAAPPTTLATNLPEGLPPLIGRQDDLAALADLVAAHRLVTLVGAAGIGKTRLAQHLLLSRRGTLEHGVTWVELAPVTDLAQLIGNLAAALGVRTGSGAPLAALVAALKPLAVLIALDNAEHLADAVSDLVQALLDDCPQVRLLVTSQAPLKLAHERLYRLGALAVPEATDTPPSPAEALRHGAVALFVERAQAADRHFRLDDNNVCAVVEVCRQLDGMALALELAAARVPLLGMLRLQAALADRLRVLTSGHRGAPVRQQTLRAALEWSLGLLNPIEQQVFCRLGVLAGGFTLDLAQQVAADAAGGPLDEWAVLEALGALVDRSLVSVDAQATPRYALLASPRLLALERLAASGDADALHRRHAQAVCGLFAARDADLQAGRLGHDDLLRQLEPELDNARAALAWAGTHEPAWAVALVPGMALALGASRSPERRAVWEQTAALVTDTLALPLRARWHLGAGHPQAIAAQTRRERLQTALVLYRQLGDAVMVHRAITDLLSMAAYLAEADREALHAERLALESAAQARGTLSNRQRLFGQQAEAFYRSARGERAAADAAHQQMLLLADHVGGHAFKNTLLNNLADSALADGRVDEAVHRGRERVLSLAGSRDRSGLAFARLNLTNALLARGDTAAAQAQALAGAPGAALFALERDWADVLAGLAAQQGRPRTAARLCGHADAAYAQRAEVREHNEARIRAQAEALARAALGDTEFDRLRQAGGGLDFASASTLALGEQDPA